MLQDSSHLRPTKQTVRKLFYIERHIVVGALKLNNVLGKRFFSSQTDRYNKVPND